MDRRMTRFLIVETDNFGGDYPDEKFVEPLPIFNSQDQARIVSAAINSSIPDRLNAPRWYKVVEEGYKLVPGFEP
jgi:hypothetical protein